MSHKPRYDKGDWKTICDICGRIWPASSLRKRWDNYMVCPSDFEIRQPQDFVKGVPDIQTPAWTRPEQADQFIPVSTPLDTTSVVDFAVVDYAIIDTPFPPWFSLPPPLPPL